MGTRVIPINGPEVNLHFVTEKAQRLVGSCIVANVPSGSYDPRQLVIEGEWRRKLFWAATICQVADRAEGPWRTISPPATRRGGGSIVVEPKGIVRNFKVDLEPFRDYFDKYTLGRIVLSSGDGDIFYLNNVKPPKSLFETAEE